MNVERSGSAGRAVFLSYASQDAEAAKRICDALRQAGVEVWFDQSELRGGDAWDAMIRKRIKECSLFVPVITPTTNARAEGYFRLEWKLAVDRSHLMADDAPFLFPIVIGDVTDATARVPDKFREVQWTRLRLDETPGELAARVARLLTGNPTDNRQPTTDNRAVPNRPARWQWWMIFPVVGTLMGLMFAVAPLWKTFNRSSRAEPPKIEVPAVPAKPALSEARQLAAKARSLVDAIDSTADDFAAAEGLIKRALELDATDGEVWAVSSRVNSAYLSRGFERSTTRRETARSQAERAVKLAPDLPEAWLALGRGIGNTDAVRAEEAFRRGLALAPNDGRLLLGLGSIYRQTNRFDEALAIYEQAAAVPETRALARYDQYLIHFYSRRFAEADRCLRESISVSKSSNMVAGLALLEVTWRGDVAQALRVLAEAPADMRGQTRVVLAGVLVNLMAGKPDAALRDFDRLPADYVNDAWYTGPKGLLVGLAHDQAGRPEAARVAWEAGLAVVRRRLQDSPNDLENHLRLGELLAWTGQTEAALQEARIFNELQRGRLPDWTYSAARIHAALGRVDDALPLLEQLLAAPSSNRWPLTPALLRIDPLWSKLRGDPRFQKLCQEHSVQTPVPAAKVDDKSVAVLAFANLSDDKANEYFSDGISEELLNVLAKVPGLKVTARTSSFYFKGKETPIPEIAQKLGVAYVVEGSVRKAGDKVRITAQLIKAADGFHVWSDTFTRDLKDIFAVQDEIAGLIAKELKLTLVTVGGDARIVDPVAMELYLRGRQAWALRTPESLREAEQLMQQAIARQPGFARAHVGLADVWLIQNEAGQLLQFSNRQSSEWTRIEARLAEAARLDPDSAELQATLGNFANVRWDFVAAEVHFRRAIELNPNYATALQWYARYLTQQGRMDEALRRIDAAMVADPFAPRIVSNAAMIHVLAGLPQRGLELAERALALPGSQGQARTWKYEALLALDRKEELAALLRRELSANPTGSRHVHATYLAQAGFTEEAKALYASPDSADRLYGAIRDHLVFGRVGEALALLDADHANYAACEWMSYLPLFDPIRYHPRFQQMLARLGLTEAHARAQAWRQAHPPEKPAAKP